MKRIAPRYQIPLLIGLCALAALALIPAVHIPAPSAPARAGAAAPLPPGPVKFSDTPPTMHEVAAKHLFIAQRKATGQKSFPDLVVKGIFIGAEKSVVLSLKSRPQANLRVWEGGSDRALSQITKPDDPRQPLAAFLREWKVKEISFNGVSVEHQITGEVETYAVDYTPERKVADDASRGYGQGTIPQAGESSAASGSGPRPAAIQPGSPNSGMLSPSPQMIAGMAERISSVMQRMSPDQQRQLLQQLGRPQGGSTNSASGANRGSRSSGGTGGTGGAGQRSQLSR